MAKTNTSLIEVKNLQKDYDDDGNVTQALRGVSCKIDKGEFVSIIGPSGSGKSTLMHIMSFLDRPTGGHYTFKGKGINDLTDKELAHVRNEELGFVFQSFNLLGRSTVYENVELPLLYSELDPSLRREKVEKAVESVGLTEKLYMAAAKLSGGQKQRVAIARALVNNPNVLFADEPTGNLDSKSGAQIMQILDELNEKGHTIILVTHETTTAQFANRILTLRDGMIESDEPVKNRRRSQEFFK